MGVWELKDRDERRMGPRQSSDQDSILLQSSRLIKAKALSPTPKRDRWCRSLHAGSQCHRFCFSAQISHIQPKAELPTRVGNSTCEGNTSWPQLVLCRSGQNSTVWEGFLSASAYSFCNIMRKLLNFSIFFRTYNVPSLFFRTYHVPSLSESPLSMPTSVFDPT